MSDNANDPIEECLTEYSHISGAEAWADYKRRFATSPENLRKVELVKMESYLPDGVRPTKTIASVWQKQRELRQLHADLLKIGR